MRNVWPILLSLSLPLTALASNETQLAPLLNKMVSRAGQPPNAACPGTVPQETDAWENAGFKSTHLENWPTRKLYSKKSWARHTHALELTFVLFRGVCF